MRSICLFPYRQVIQLVITFAITLLNPLGAFASSQVPLLDSTFAASGGPDSTVSAIVIQNDGHILIGGDFQSFAGQPCTNLAHLSEDGQLDNSFGGGTDGEILGLVQQPDGKILVSGSFTMLQGVPCLNLGRLLPDGEVDTNFDVGTLFQTNGLAYKMALQPDGKILIGSVLPLSGRLFRLDTNGTLDETFVQTNFFDAYWIHSLFVQTNGAIFAGGGFQDVNGFASPGLVLLDASGNIETNFQSTLGNFSDVFSILQQTNGGFLIGGILRPSDGSVNFPLARLTPGLVLDTNFNPSTFTLVAPQSGIRSAFLQADGKIVAGGEFDQVGGYWRQSIVRLDQNGQVDPCFDPGPGLGNQFGVIAVVGQSDGKILVGGMFGIPGLVPGNLVRLFPQGECSATRAYIFNDGTSYVAAGTTTPGGTNFLQMSTDLTNWTDLDSETNPFVSSPVDISKEPASFFRVKKVY